MQKEQEKELAAIKERQRNLKEMTEKIMWENEELKRMTIGHVEARKTQKKLNEEFVQLRQNDNPSQYTAVHNRLQTRLNFLTR
jgi:coenzyme F420-reducing hydrogenase delta subunit